MTDGVLIRRILTNVTDQELAYEFFTDHCTPRLGRVIHRAIEIRETSGDEFIGTDTMLMALLNEGSVRGLIGDDMAAQIEAKLTMHGLKGRDEQRSKHTLARMFRNLGQRVKAIEERARAYNEATE